MGCWEIPQGQWPELLPELQRLGWAGAIFGHFFAGKSAGNVWKLEAAFVYFSYQITLFFHAETSGNYDFSMFFSTNSCFYSCPSDVCIFAADPPDTSFAWHPIKHRTLEIWLWDLFGNFSLAVSSYLQNQQQICRFCGLSISVHDYKLNGFGCIFDDI